MQLLHSNMSAVSGRNIVRKVKCIAKILLKANYKTHSRAAMWGVECQQHKHYSSLSSHNKRGGRTISIGDIVAQLKSPTTPELVPKGYLPADIPQSVLHHLKWMIQKDLLGQDMFLIGPPGPSRRTLAMMYLELMQKEVEYVSLSRDTTESDLKQRREIKSGSAFHIDQCAVRAALYGRVLILDGIEKAERNVLPVLNNLLENREMQLDDGRLLVCADRYDKLLQTHSKQELDDSKLVRVNEAFRVIALGLPVPRYQGNPLDPPLRSRFQARDVQPLSYKEMLEQIEKVGWNIADNRLSQILSFSSTLLSTELQSLGLPDFPITNLPLIVKILNLTPDYADSQILSRIYPHKLLLNQEGRTAVLEIMKKFELLPPSGRKPLDRVIRMTNDDPDLQQKISTLLINDNKYELTVKSGTLEKSASKEHFVRTEYHDNLLTEMIQSHSVHDFCVIGPKGCGKTAIVNEFARLLSYDLEPMMLYEDMTARDLLQQRMTLENGDTMWRPSPLVTAAIEGRIAVLDGLHRINPGTLSVLNRLIHDRELTLFDGTRLTSHDRYEKIKQDTYLTDQQLRNKNCFPIHRSFRIIGLSEPPRSSSSLHQWLGSDQLTMFLYHQMRPLSINEETRVLDQIVMNGDLQMKPLLNLAHLLRKSNDATMQSLASSLSTRQLIRITRRLATNPTESLYEAVHKACLYRFLPHLARDTLDQMLEKSGIFRDDHKQQTMTNDEPITCKIKGGILTIGQTSVEIYQPENKIQVPDVLFFENDQHLKVMEDMLKDFVLGEHLLLVGNQGVGKNKIVDRFLHLLNRPREYLQLHRDTTVQSMTIQPTVRDGVILYEDSPLVKAVKYGNILVIDEADKAPTNVTCILKTLVESGEMHLADGRRIVPVNFPGADSEKLIHCHPDFRMIVLANRPGFPFLGNDFFGAIGDIFSCHAVDNPGIGSEMAMLRQYGPDISEEILMKLVLAFGELRMYADRGLIDYPYSTREVISIVKHLQKFPNEGLAKVTENVLDFDLQNKEMLEKVVKTLQKHGIPIGAKSINVHLAKEFPIPKLAQCGTWRIDLNRITEIGGPNHMKPIEIKGPVKLEIESHLVETYSARGEYFSELMNHFMLPIDEYNVILDIAVTKARDQVTSKNPEDSIHVVTGNPITLYTTAPSGRNVSRIDLSDVFPRIRGSFRPRIRLTALGAPLEHNVILHEQVTNVLLNIDSKSGLVSRLNCTLLPETTFAKIFNALSSKDTTANCHQMISSFSHIPGSQIVFFKQNSMNLDVMDVWNNKCHPIKLPFEVDNVQMISLDTWMLTESDTMQKYLLSRQELNYQLKPVIEEVTTQVNDIRHIGSEPIGENAILHSTDSASRLFMSSSSYAGMIRNFPESQGPFEILTSCREPLHEKQVSTPEQQRQDLFGIQQQSTLPTSYPIFLSESGFIIQTLPIWRIPQNVLPEDVKHHSLLDTLSGFLEVVNPGTQRVKYVPVPRASQSSPNSSWLNAISDTNIIMAPLSNDGIVTVDAGGCVRCWEVVPTYINSSLDKWHHMVGEDGRPLQLERQSGNDVNKPKHGKIDPENTPHVGGNTWAGGTGGRDTAGLGGKGGPYRLDAGHDVHQIPDSEKDDIPLEVKQAAREMAQKAFKQRLKDIKMSEYDAQLYEKLKSNVDTQIRSLRVMIDNLQRKGKERQWLRHQTQGELDESKLIEGLAGEKGIYRRRGELPPELGTPQELPKRLRLVVDLSGSMYRFNGYDGRLDRQMETTLMVLEAFDGYQNKIKVDIVGHSGEDYDIELSKLDQLPADNQQRLQVLKTMHAHSQFCMSGDHTLHATKHAIHSVSKEFADEKFVIVLSDANLDRYGIEPTHFAQILTADEDVNAFVIFVGSLGKQANHLVKNLPSGKGFVCMDTETLPKILQNIFTSTVLS
ncbi:von Willebrand factor A domain-containing protein 8-like isoform X2 [Tubulanus polymorphus]|uniref:von Willebrand factor A domain-containing protein 8-like isoform X2 n=1 Tax=Tubulanus polymorphus TaxID=672921 RepID=UPI003DA4B67C